MKRMKRKIGYHAETVGSTVFLDSWNIYGVLIDNRKGLEIFYGYVPYDLTFF